MKRIPDLDFNFIVFAGLLFFILVSCSENYYPKPHGYYRIELPEKKYLAFDSVFPYAFEVPVYSMITPDHDPMAEKYWINIEFPRFKGKLHLSYKKINGNLNDYLEDTRAMVMKHIPKASAIENKTYENPSRKVYGLTYTISGTAAASPYQFYLTDSTENFVRGALYFDVAPNNDSLAPVIDFLKEDINHLIETFEWREY
ncbi:MAG: gliding motility lipoprotein GldD [Bacteroidetes bacterium]|nr:gliding motility lipoprotein GldD [Bacteroidota bacterium]